MTLVTLFSFVCVSYASFARLFLKSEKSTKASAEVDSAFTKSFVYYFFRGAFNGKNACHAYISSLLLFSCVIEPLANHPSNKSTGVSPTTLVHVTVVPSASKKSSKMLRCHTSKRTPQFKAFDSLLSDYAQKGEGEGVKALHQEVNCKSIFCSHPTREQS